MHNKCTQPNHKYTILTPIKDLAKRKGGIEVVIILFINIWVKPIWHMFMVW